MSSLGIGQGLAEGVRMGGQFLLAGMQMGQRKELAQAEMSQKMALAQAEMSRKMALAQQTLDANIAWSRAMAGLPPAYEEEQAAEQDQSGVPDLPTTQVGRLQLPGIPYRPTIAPRPVAPTTGRGPLLGADGLLSRIPPRLKFVR